MADISNNSTAIVPSGGNKPVVVGRTVDGRPILQYVESHFGSEEMAIKPDNPRWVAPSVFSRSDAPEEAPGDIVSIPPEQWFETADRMVDSVVQIEGALTWLKGDWKAVANIQYLRDACSVLNVRGRNDQATYPLAISSGVHSAQNFSSPNSWLGFQVEWGISPLQGAAFNMNLVTTGFKGAGGQSVDRSFTLRANPNFGTGGIFIVLFASRIQGTSAGYYYSGDGGMAIPIVQLAEMGNYDNTYDRAPRIAITCPSTLDTFLSFNVRPLSAASPALAALRGRLNALTGG